MAAVIRTPNAASVTGRNVRFACPNALQGSAASPYPEAEIPGKPGGKA
jgi:hypothetical protein